ncbi:MAG: hypothetical protein WC855_13270 [Thermodesulfovibrionales bacterium]
MSKALTPVKAIRAKCLDCCCNQTKEVKLCPVKNCALYPYRMGTRPKATLESETYSFKKGNETASEGKVFSQFKAVEGIPA